MRSLHVTIVSALAATLLAACATAPKDTAMLTYQTKPEGAQIYEGKTLLGTAPVVRTYQLAGKASLDTPEVTAVWASGAKTSFWTRVQAGDDRVADLVRPAAAPNLQADLDAAIPVAKARQAEADRNKDQLLRDQKRASAACQEAMAKGNMTVAANVCN